jgi:hypothetical protein
MSASDDTRPTDARDVLRTVWDAQGDPSAALDDDCSPTKVCKNMKDVSFDGFAEPGTDLRTAWRERLEREGKLNPAGGSIRDLVLGNGEAR